MLALRVAYGLEFVDKMPTPPDYELLTVEKCMYDWLEEKNSNGDLKPASYRMYDARIRNHILPVFGTQPVRLLTYNQLKEFFRVTLPEKNLGVSSIRQTFVAFKSALDYYQRDRIITAHPMTGLKVPRAKALDKKDKTQIRRASKFLNEHLLKWAREEDVEARWFLALLGLRQGEVLGMTDDSLVTRGSGKSRTRRVVVKHQLQHESATHGCGRDSTGKWLCGGTSPNCPKKIGEARWVHGLDPLPDPTELSESGVLVFAIGADQVRTELVGNEGFELAARESLVADDHLSGLDEVSVVAKERFGDVAFADLRVREPPDHGHPVGGAEQVEAEAPEEPGMGRAVPVAGVPGKIGAFHGLTRLPARQWGGIDQPRQLTEGGGVPGELGDHRGQQPQ